MNNDSFDITKKIEIKKKLSELWVSGFGSDIKFEDIEKWAAEARKEYKKCKNVSVELEERESDEFGHTDTYFCVYGDALETDKEFETRKNHILCDWLRMYESYRGSSALYNRDEGKKRIAILKKRYPQHFGRKILESRYGKDFPKDIE